jgi:hypothetical protein
LFLRGLAQANPLFFAFFLVMFSKAIQPKPSGLMLLAQSVQKVI